MKRHLWRVLHAEPDYRCLVCSHCGAAQHLYPQRTEKQAQSLVRFWSWYVRTEFAIGGEA